MGKIFQESNFLGRNYLLLALWLFRDVSSTKLQQLLSPRFLRLELRQNLKKIIDSYKNEMKIDVFRFRSVHIIGIFQSAIFLVWVVFAG